MKLTYRGISYNYNPPEVIYGPVFAQGHYRGQAVGFRNPERLPVDQPILELKYRNVAYTTQPAARSPEPVAAAPVATVPAEAWVAIAPETMAATSLEQPATPATPRVDTTIADRARALMMQHHVKVMRREEGMLSRVFAEIGLPVEQASHHAGRIQGKIHSNYWASYDRSHASMS